MIINEIRMNKRRNKEFMAGMILEGKSYLATIENLSETGIKLRVVTPDTAVHYFPHAITELRFETKEEVPLRLTCRVVWSIKKSEDRTFTDVGLEITEKPQQYDDLLKNIDMNITLLMEDYDC